jgi:hypothetical protein
MKVRGKPPARLNRKKPFRLRVQSLYAKITSSPIFVGFALAAIVSLSVAAVYHTNSLRQERYAKTWAEYERRKQMNFPDR